VASSVPICVDGDITDNVGVAECSGTWESSVQFDAAELDVEVMATTFAGGFVLVGTAWAIGFAVRTLLRMISR
jgi:hypothetical protein